MTPPYDYTTPDSGHDAADHTASPLPIQSVDEAMNEIDRILHQMLLLAELSASDGSVNRAALQKTLERLQAKIDRIADRLDSTES